MMIFLSAAASAICALCASPNLDGHEWLSGTYTAKPVASRLQNRMATRLKERSLERIELQLARDLTGDADLPVSQYYYLAKTAFIGGNEDSDELPHGISVSVDVDENGVAYITTYRLTKEKKERQFAIVISSSTPLNDIVSICGSAE